MQGYSVAKLIAKHRTLCLSRPGFAGQPAAHQHLGAGRAPTGDARLKHKGRILTTEEAAALRKTRWDAENSYALPPDIQISVEDAF